MEFTGAPVVYVPGNSGSYKQARSFASVAIRKGLDNNWNHHLDYFTGECLRIQNSSLVLLNYLVREDAKALIILQFVTNPCSGR